MERSAADSAVFEPAGQGAPRVDISLKPRALGGNVFVSTPQDTRLGRSFGGRLVAEAMAAASQTVDPSYVPHSAHAQFIAAGDLLQPTRYSVEILRDGRSFASRAVRVTQGDELITMVLVSLSQDREGPFHQRPMPDVGGPDAYADHSAGRDAVKASHPVLGKLLWPREHPLEIRPVDFPTEPTDRPAHMSYWFRAKPELTDSADPAARAALVTYMTDRFVMTSPSMPILSRLDSHDVLRASLDHSVWIHRDHAPGGWLFYDITNTTTQGSRAFVRGEVFDEQGAHIASVSQEGLMLIRARPTEISDKA